LSRADPRCQGKRPAACAAAALQAVAGVQVSGRHVQRLTREVGTDRARLPDEPATQRRRRQLAPRVAAPPPVAVVEVDGGR
jgi:hypothetical protein